MEAIQRDSVTKIGYRDILKQHNFCKLVLANLINRFGDSVDALAFTWLVYQVTKSASWSAIIYALNILPTMLLQPFAGAFVEKKSKKKLMIVMDIMRGLFVIVLAVSYITQVINPWIMAAFTLIISSFEAFCIPASTAIIPKLLDEKYYEFGTSLNSAASRVVELAGTAVAGIIIGLFGIGTAILIDAVTFFASAIIKGSIKLTEKTAVEIHGKEAVAQYVNDLKGGISYVKTKQVVLNYCIMAFLLNAMLVPLNSLQSPLVISVLKQGSGLLSAIGIAMTLGLGIATVVYPYLASRTTQRNFICINGGGLAVSIGLITAGRLVTDNRFIVSDHFNCSIFNWILY